MATQMMRAIRFHKYGNAEELVLQDIPRPDKPGEGQVLVRVHAEALEQYLNSHKYDGPASARDRSAAARVAAVAPFWWAEPWDNVGLIAGDPTAVVTAAQDPAVAAQLIDWFRAQAKVFYMGGTPAYWRTLTNDSLRDPRWTGVYEAAGRGYARMWGEDELISDEGPNCHCAAGEHRSIHDFCRKPGVYPDAGRRLPDGRHRSGCKCICW